MKNKAVFIAALAAMLAVPAMAGVTVKIEQNFSNPEYPYSPYKLTVGSDWNGLGGYAKDDVILTFCVETNRFFDNGSYTATIDDVIKNGGASTNVNPPVAPKDQTKKIYAAFLSGGNQIGSFTANQIQREIWSWESGASSGAIYNWVMANANYSAWNYVKVLNPSSAKYPDAQSQLIMIVPAPGAVLLGGLGISLVGWLRRRKQM